VTVSVVRAGQTVRKQGAHYIIEMILQVALEYAGIPDIRTLSFNHIKLFYKGLEKTLIDATKDKKG